MSVRALGRSLERACHRGDEAASGTLQLLTRRAMLVGLAGVAGVGCPKPIAPPVRVGMALWPPYEMFHLAESLGYYPSPEVQLIDIGSLAEVQRAYESNVIDALCTTADYALHLSERSQDHRIVLVIDFSSGGDTVVARRDVDRLEALKGKRVGFEVGGLGVQVLMGALARAGLSTRDVILTPVDLIDQEAALVNGRVDAVVTYEPVRTKLIARAARELFSTKDIPGEIVDVLVTRTSLIEGRGAVLQKVVDGWFRAGAYLVRNPIDAAQRVRARQGLTVDQYLRALRGAEIVSLDDNRRLLSGPSAALLPTLRKISDVAVRDGILKGPVDPTPLLDDRFVRAVQP